MALTTFLELQTFIADMAWGEVTAAQIKANFLPQAQARMYRGDGLDIQPLRISQMVDSATVIPAAGGMVTISSAISATWLEFIEIVPNMAGAVSLNYVAPWDFRKEADAIANTVGPQNIYTIEGDVLYAAPAAVNGLKAKWYEKFTALSADADTDWILANAPHVYINGCMMEIMAYLQDGREGEFRAKFAASIKALNLNDQRARSSGSVKVARPRRVV
jgi:hypothetical protein